MNNTILIMTYNPLSNYQAGAHGNGAVVILYADEDKFAANEETAGMDLHMQTFNLLDRNVADAYIYFGKYAFGGQDVRTKMFKRMVHTAMSHIKDPAHIHMVSCTCNENYKRRFARGSGFDYIACECRGRTTLEKIVRDVLAKVPKDEQPIGEEPTLIEVFRAPEQETGFLSGNNFTKFA